jgi:hypothetical protein
MSDRLGGTTPTTPADNAEHLDYDDRSAHAVFRRVADGLGIPLEHIAGTRRDDAERRVVVFAVTSAVGIPEIQVGTAVLTPDEATALARHIRQVVAQQRAKGLWSLLRTLGRAGAADLGVDVRYGLRCVAAYGPRRRSGAR